MGKNKQSEQQQDNSQQKEAKKRQQELQQQKVKQETKQAAKQEEQEEEEEEDEDDDMLRSCCNTFVPLVKRLVQAAIVLGLIAGIGYVEYYRTQPYTVQYQKILQFFDHNQAFKFVPGRADASGGRKMKAQRDDPETEFKYWETLHIPIYHSDEEPISVKDFMINHITSYYPGVWELYAKDWEAYEWQTINQTHTSFDNLMQLVGDLEVSVHNSRSNINYKDDERHDIKKITVSQLFQEMKKNSKNQNKDISYLADEPLPQILLDQVQIPEATTQLLRLGNVTWDIFQGGVRQQTHLHYYDVMHCVLAGEEDVQLISAWEWHRMHAGNKGVNVTNEWEYPEVDMRYSPLNIKTPEMSKFPRSRGLHPVQFTLEKGDCLYIPNHWWIQQTSMFPNPLISVNFNYDISSYWMSNIVHGFESEKI